MRILITGTTYLPARNGQATFTTNLAEGLARRGHTIYMVYPSETGQSYKAERNGVQICTASSVSLNKWHDNAAISIFPRKEVCKCLDEFQPELVHIHDHFWLSHSFMVEARQRGLKVLGTNHFMPENLAPYAPLIGQVKPVFNYILWKWMMLTYNKVHLVTAQSKASASLLRSEGLRVPIQSVSCGIDLKRFNLKPQLDRQAVRQHFGLSTDRTVLLYVGRIDKEKKLDLLFHALAKLNRPDIEFAIAGRGSAFADLEKLSHSLGLEGRVHFLGYVLDSELADLVNSTDIFVMPSEVELLSIASLEAMACGRPLLLANAMALSELVVKNENGRLFRPGDLDNLACCISELVDCRHDWPSMQAASLRHAEAHSLEHVISRYEEIYSSMLKDVP